MFGTLGRKPYPMPVLPRELFKTDAQFLKHCEDYHDAFVAAHKENKRRQRIESRLMAIFLIVFAIGVPIGLYGIVGTFIDVMR